MRRLYICSAAFAALAVALGYASAAGADPPPPGAQPVRETFTNPTSYGATQDVFILSDSVPLPSAACEFTPSDPRTGAHPNLSLFVHGWQIWLDPITLGKIVSEHAEVHGTVDDALGNTYRVDGGFDESGVQPWGVEFEGDGHIALAGRAGVVSGEGRFTYVGDNPPDWELRFTNVQNCSIR
jgi:hypothetical protein